MHWKTKSSGSCENLFSTTMKIENFLKFRFLSGRENLEIELVFNYIVLFFIDESPFGVPGSVLRRKRNKQLVMVK